MMLANKKYILVETIIIKEMKFRLEKYSFFIPISNGCNKKETHLFSLLFPLLKNML